MLPHSPPNDTVPQPSTSTSTSPLTTSVTPPTTASSLTIPPSSSPSPTSSSGPLRRHSGSLCFRHVRLSPIIRKNPKDDHCRIRSPTRILSPLQSPARSLPRHVMLREFEEGEPETGQVPKEQEMESAAATAEGEEEDDDFSFSFEREMPSPHDALPQTLTMTRSQSPRHSPRRLRLSFDLAKRRRGKNEVLPPFHSRSKSDPNPNPNFQFSQQTPQEKEDEEEQQPDPTPTPAHSFLRIGNGNGRANPPSQVDQQQELKQKPVSTLSPMKISHESCSDVASAEAVDADADAEGDEGDGGVGEGISIRIPEEFGFEVLFGRERGRGSAGVLTEEEVDEDGEHVDDECVCVVEEEESVKGNEDNVVGVGGVGGVMENPSHSECECCPMVVVSPSESANPQNLLGTDCDVTLAPIDLAHSIHPTTTSTLLPSSLASFSDDDDDDDDDYGVAVEENHHSAGIKLPSFPRLLSLDSLDPGADPCPYPEADADPETDDADADFGSMSSLFGLPALSDPDSLAGSVTNSLSFSSPSSSHLRESSIRSCTERPGTGAEEEEEEDQEEKGSDSKKKETVSGKTSDLDDLNAEAVRFVRCVSVGNLLRKLIGGIVHLTCHSPRFRLVWLLLISVVSFLNVVILPFRIVFWTRWEFLLLDYIGDICLWAHLGFLIVAEPQMAQMAMLEDDEDKKQEKEKESKEKGEEGEEGEEKEKEDDANDKSKCHRGVFALRNLETVRVELSWKYVGRFSLIPMILILLPIEFVLAPLAYHVFFPDSIIVTLQGYAYIWQLFRIPRLMNSLLGIRTHVAQITRWIGKHAPNVNLSYANVIETCLLTLVLVHITACSFIMLVRLQGENTSDGFTNSLDPILEMNIAQQYIRGFYWSIATITGYNNTQPQTALELVMSLVVSSYGIVLYIIIIAGFGSLLSEVDVSAALFQTKMDEINEFLRFRHVSPSIARTLRSYYNHMWRSRRTLNEEEILENLPVNLRIEIILHLLGPIIEKIAFFRDGNGKLNRQFVHSLALCMKPRAAPPGVFVVREGEIAKEMYFISKGMVEVLVPEKARNSQPGEGAVEPTKKRVALLKEGRYFGAVAILIQNAKRTGWIRCLTDCDFFVIDKDDFIDVLNRFPEQKRIVRAEAHRKRAIAMLNRARGRRQRRQKETRE